MLGTPPAEKLPAAWIRASERYADAAARAGCPPDQVANFIRGGVVLQERQLQASAAARQCDLPGGPTKIGYGGARGGGKSHWMLAQMVADDCVRYPGLKCLMLRKVGRALRENFEDLLRKALAGVAYTYIPTRSLLQLPNGSQVLLGHFQRERDIDAYLGLEYDIIGVEEATTLSSSKHKSIETCNRTSKPGWRPRMYSTTNPGNLGHAWYKALFIAPYRAGQETSTRFIPATIDDNACVNAEYRQVLDGLTGWQKAAWRFGSWDIAAGQFFTTFRTDVHVRKFELAAHWKVWGALDYGFTHFTTAYLLGQNDDGDIFIADEHAERRWLPQRHAPAIKAMFERHGRTVESLWKFVAGRDVFDQRGDKDGLTISDTYRELGIKLSEANTDRVNGAAEILARLGDVDAVDSDKKPAPVPPRLFIHERCARLIACLPELQHDPRRPEDVLKVNCDDDGLGGDDPYDGARYGVMAVWSPKPNRIERPAMANPEQRRRYGYA